MLSVVDLHKSDAAPRIIHATMYMQHPADSFFRKEVHYMPEISRTERVKAERKKKREEGLVIFRYAADLFRFVDTLYRLIRMML